ncbi:MAG: hypothetical protein ACM3Q1_05890 [Bacteroidales bacterium]
MRIFHYHPNTGVLLGEGVADTCPVTGGWLIPAHATEQAPPSAPDENRQVVWDGGWCIRPIPPASVADALAPLSERDIILALLADLDREVPRVLEDVITATGVALPPAAAAKVARKQELRAQLKALG